MTKRTRRAIASRLEEIEEERDEPTEWNVHSDVRVITDDMVDDSGNTIEEKLPEPEPPDGWELGRVIPTESPVVTWRELTPVDDE
ncbi:hypothetical protein ABNG03_19355 [Halorubrum sp. RMP-47]|uniref:hypothetical protein n=1 Tax=Halorubrum miltondacostae TaxID=3076378 RepID=UPI0035279FBD